MLLGCVGLRLAWNLRRWPGQRRFWCYKIRQIHVSSVQALGCRMKHLQLGDTLIQLLPQRAVHMPQHRALLVSDVHLGKSETFQHFGIPVPSAVHQSDLNRLQALCDTLQPDSLWILGDLFHGLQGMTDAVIDSWLTFLDHSSVEAHLLIGNHDRALGATIEQLSLHCFGHPVALGDLLLSHEPYTPATPQVNVCGHVHPCVRLEGGGDCLRLPCFYWEPHHQRLTLPAFGEFTGGYTVALRQGSVAYTIAEDQVIAFA